MPNDYCLQQGCYCEGVRVCPLPHETDIQVKYCKETLTLLWQCTYLSYSITYSNIMNLYLFMKREMIIYVQSICDASFILQWWLHKQLAFFSAT